jgi:hypothetical protein
MSEPQFSEEELRALEAEMERITVDDVLLQTVVSLLNLGGRKRDLEQVRLAIEGTRALLPVLEPRHGDKLGPVRDTLSRLQMFYAQAAGQAPGEQPPPPAPEEPPAPKPGEAGPAQRSGRLWVPGQ